EATQVGPVRVVLGCAFLFLALYLAPALFGNPPRGPIYDRLVVGILPADADELRSQGALLTSGQDDRNGIKSVNDGSSVPVIIPAKSNDPEVAIREQRYIQYGVSWGFSLDQAIDQAKANGRAILIDFTGVNCASCRTMEQNVFPNENVVRLM